TAAPPITSPGISAASIRAAPATTAIPTATYCFIAGLHAAVAEPSVSGVTCKKNVATPAHGGKGAAKASKRAPSRADGQAQTASPGPLAGGVPLWTFRDNAPNQIMIFRFRERSNANKKIPGANRARTPAIGLHRSRRERPCVPGLYREPPDRDRGLSVGAD